MNDGHTRGAARAATTALGAVAVLSGVVGIVGVVRGADRVSVYLVVLVTLLIASIGLAVARRTVASQACATVVAVVAYAAIVAFLLGGRSDVADPSDFPRSTTSLPFAISLLSGAVAIVMGQPDRGMWAWLNAQGSGRSILRRIVVPVVLAPLVVIAIARAVDLEERLGEPRADAAVVTVLALLFLAAAVASIREIDRLADEANRRHLADSLAVASADAARQAGLIAELAGRVSATSSVDGVVGALLSDGPTTLGAEMVGFGLPDPDLPVLWVRHSVDGMDAAPVPEDLGTMFRSPIVQAFESGRAVWISDVPDDDHPHIVDELRAAGVVTLVALPLVSSSGQAIGAMTVGWGSGVAVDDALRSRVATVAELCSQTLQRALLTRAEHRLIAGLQERLVGLPPALSLLDLDVRYQPAAEIGMGGDWYDVVESDDGQVTVVLGDVSGHGVDAVADMAQIRTLIGLLVRQRVELGEILHQVDDLLGREDPIMATVALVQVDPRAGVIRHTCAGHPPVALRGADGSVRLVEGGRRPLLGAGITTGPVEPERLAFGPGTAAVIYSDGLVERRGEDLNDGLERLRRSVASAPRGPASEIAGHLISEMLGEADAVDDTALVVLLLPQPLFGDVDRATAPGTARAEPTGPSGGRPVGVRLDGAR